MAWNLPDGKKPSFPKKDGKEKESGGSGQGAVQRASSWFSLLNCFEGGRFRPLRFAVMLSLVLLAAEALQQYLAAPGDKPPVAGGKP